MSFFGTNAFEVIFNFLDIIIFIAALIVALELFKAVKKEEEIKPWKMLFYALIAYGLKKAAFVFEAGFGIILVHETIFEFIIAGLFVYAVLLQTEFVLKNKK